MKPAIGVHAACLAVLLGLAACASSGNEILRDQTRAVVDTNIVDGKTTRDQVQALYGQPRGIGLSAKNEVWTYTWARVTAQGQNFVPIVGAFMRGYDREGKRLIIVFDENNIVVRHSMTDYRDTVRTGLIDKGQAAATTVPPPAATTPSPAATTPPPASSSFPPASPAPPSASTSSSTPSAQSAPASPAPASPPAGANVAPASPAPSSDPNQSRFRL